MGHCYVHFAFVFTIIMRLPRELQVCQSESSGFMDRRSGQIAYCHGVKTGLSTLGTGEGDVPCGSDST